MGKGGRWRWGKEGGREGMGGTYFGEEVVASGGQGFVAVALETAGR